MNSGTNLDALNSNWPRDLNGKNVAHSSHQTWLVGHLGSIATPYYRVVCIVRAYCFDDWKLFVCVFES